MSNELLVNYDLTVEALVQECGFDWNNNGDINSKNFPTKRTGQHKVETKIYHFGKSMTSEEVFAEMEKDGFRPAELHELLTYRKKNPDEQIRCPVVELNSVWGRWGDRRFAVRLDGASFGRARDRFNYHEERYLILSDFDNEWGEYDRFLAVRES